MSAVFVNAGIDWTQPLGEQNDSFWWGGEGFDGHDQPFGGFRRVVRGYDPAHRGKAIGTHTAIVDGGCGRDGTLNAACLGPDGDFLEWIEV
jgi:serine/threonine protein phosphatase 1